jgi:hypothetical protein
VVLIVGCLYSVAGCRPPSSSANSFQTAEHWRETAPEQVVPGWNPRASPNVGLLQQHARGGSQVPVGTVKSRLSRARAALLIGRDRDAPTTGRPAKGLPWRPLVANEWKASVQDERPLDPVSPPPKASVTASRGA